MQQSSSEFLDSVIVTGSRTVIDEDAMTSVHQELHGVLSTFALLNAALDDAAQWAQAAAAQEGNDWDICARISLLQARMNELERRMLATAENVALALMIFLAAEGRAAEFFALRAQVYPSSPNHCGAFLEKTIFPSVEHGLAGVLYDSWLPIVGRRWALFAGNATQTLSDFIPFATRRGGDRADLFAASLHLEKTSKVLMGGLSPQASRHILTNGQVVDAVKFHRSEHRGSWWNSPASYTPKAAAVMAMVGYGAGVVTHGRNVGVGVSGTVPDAYGSHKLLTLQASDAVSPVQNLLPLHGSVTAGFALKNMSRKTHSHYDADRLTARGAPRTVSDRADLRDFARIMRSESSPRTVATPTQPSALLSRIDRLANSQDYGEFEILRHQTPQPNGEERTSWSVIIRGTQKWDTGGSNPQDMQTNFEGVAALDSDQLRAIRRGMASAGIGRGEPVEFVGHSQGGIVAAQLASDPQIVERYDVAAVLTAGAPTGHYAPQAQAGVVHLENTRDLVPAIDGVAANVDAPGTATVYFDSYAMDIVSPGQQPRFAHGLDVYHDALSRLETSDDQRVHDIALWRDSRQRAMGFTQETATTSYVFTTSRIGESSDR